MLYERQFSRSKDSTNSTKVLKDKSWPATRRGSNPTRCFSSMTELELSGTAYADHQLGPWQTLASSWSQLLCRCLWLWPSHGFCELHLSTGFIIDLTVAHKHEHERLSQSSKWHRIVQVIAMAVSLMIDSHGGVAVLASAVKSLWVLNHRVGLRAWGKQFRR